MDHDLTRHDAVIYKIAPVQQWQEMTQTGHFSGSPVDKADGFIHFSTQSSVKETAEKHFSGQDDLLLIAIDSTQLGDALKWERSRGNALFPHLYSPLKQDAVLWSIPLPLTKDGTHIFPQEFIK